MEKGFVWLALGRAGLDRLTTTPTFLAGSGPCYPLVREETFWREERKRSGGREEVSRWEVRSFLVESDKAWRLPVGSDETSRQKVTKLPGGKKKSFSVVRETEKLPSEKGVSFPVGRQDLPGGEGWNFSEVMKLPSGKGGSSPVGSDEASQWKVIRLPAGKGENLSVGREEDSRWEGMKLPS